MRLLVAVCFFLPLTLLSQQHEFRSPLRDVQADSVVAYAFGLTESGDWEPLIYVESILSGGQLSEHVNRRKRCKIDDLDKLFTVIEDSASFGNSPAACFIPHHAIVWWKNGLPVHLIDVCFGCNSMHSSLETPAQSLHKLEELYEDSNGNIETYIIWNHGFSFSGRKSLILWFDVVGVGLGLPNPDEKLWDDEDD